MEEPKKVGRPSKKEAVREQLLANLREAMSVRAACALSGVGKSTFYEWVNDDKEFADEVEAAKRFSEAVMISRLKALGEEKADWRAYAWLLERRFPEEWTAKREIELNQTVNDGGAALVVQMIEQTDMRLLELQHESESSADAQLEHTASTREDELQGEG